MRDDGIGGARPNGSGLVGLADRLAVLDVRLRVESPASGGTLVAADIPIPTSSSYPVVDHRSLEAEARATPNVDRTTAVDEDEEPPRTAGSVFRSAPSVTARLAAGPHAEPHQACLARPFRDVALGAMPKKYREIRSALKAAGWEVLRQRGSHEVWGKACETAHIVVAGKDSDSVPVGTLSSIRRASGLEQLR